MAVTDAEPRVKPTKPDEAAYKATLAEAEKEHTAAQEKLVRMHFSGISPESSFESGLRE